MNVHEAAEYLGFHEEHVRRLAREGKIKGRKIGGKEWRFRPGDRGSGRGIWTLCSRTRRWMKIEQIERPPGQAAIQLQPTPTSPKGPVWMTTFIS
jgi:excisionase family DNA binding protein